MTPSKTKFLQNWGMIFRQIRELFQAKLRNSEHKYPDDNIFECFKIPTG